MSGVGILGLGAVGSRLATELVRAGETVFVWNRTKLATERIPHGARSVDRLDELGRLTSEVILCVADGALARLDQQLAELELEARPKIALHTCGALPPGVLSNLERAGCSTGLFHPLVSLPAGGGGGGGNGSELRGARFAIRGVQPATDLANRLTERLGAVPLALAGDDAAQMRYHAAASLVSGATAAVVSEATGLSAESFEDSAAARVAFAALAKSVAENLVELRPEQAATGPIARGSIELVGQHLDVLEPGERARYKAIAGLILGLCEERLKPAEFERLRALLGRPPS